MAVNDPDRVADFKRGSDAFNAGAAYDRDETEAWQRGFGDAVEITLGEDPVS